MFRKVFLIPLTLLTYTIFFNKIYASNETIKIAVLDNFRYQKYVTTKYKSYYKKGLDLAIRGWKKKGISITYKIFQYDQEPLSIFNQIPNVLKWNPDVIIGPRDSNKFLLLEKSIKNTLTISPFATSIKIEKMPSNFFSMPLSAKYSATSMYDFIENEFPKKGVYILTETECKSCVDVSQQFMKKTNSHKGVKIIKYIPFISEQISTLNIKNILKGYRKGDIFLLPNNAHNSAVLMAKISDYLPNKVAFVGGDGWGAWKDTEVGKLGDTSHYKAYHIAPWEIQDHDPNITEFKKRYKEYYKSNPVNNLSYIIYRTIQSIMYAYVNYKSNNTKPIKDRILLSYKIALNNNPYWYKPTKYSVIKIYKNTKILYAIINPITESISYHNN